MAIILVYLIGVIASMSGRSPVNIALASASPKDETSSRQVDLCIAAKRSNIRHTDQIQPNIWAEVTNQGDDPVKLGRPGDGSWTSGRTPVLRWIVRPVEDPQWEVSQSRRGLCAVISRIPRRCTIYLKPGETTELPLLYVEPRFPSPGTYLVQLEYINDPDFDLPAKYFAPGAKKRLDSSAPVRLMSNVLTITVSE